MTPRAVFLGNDVWSVPSLEALEAAPGLRVTLVVTNPARPAGRGADLRPTPVAEASRRLDMPVAEVAGVRSGPGLDALRAAEPDLLVVVAYGELLSPEVLDLPRWGAINLHFSLLPRWRGAAPVQHVLLAGDPVTGVSVMLMDEGLDTGPVLARREEPVRTEDDAGSLGGRLADIGAELLVEVVGALPSGGGDHVWDGNPQDDRLATSAPRPRAEDRRVDWTEPSIAVVRRVRAFGPDPAATTVFRDAPLKVLRAEAAEQDPGEVASAVAGTILEADDRGVTVAAGEGSVRLLEVAPAGRRRMPASAWARGARFAPGERLA